MQMRCWNSATVHIEVVPYQHAVLCRVSIAGPGECGGHRSLGGAGQGATDRGDRAEFVSDDE